MIRWFLLLCLSASLLVAQQPSPSPETGAPGFLEITMPAGTYVVRVSAITTVAMQEYVVDNAARVTEMNIGTMGGEYARFYYIEPNVPQSPNGMGQSAIDAVQDKAREAITRAGADDEVWRRVVKNYPTTTHSRTIEYRLGDKAALQKLFEKTKDAWTNNKGGTFKP